MRGGGAGIYDLQGEAEGSGLVQFGEEVSGAP